MSRPPEVDRRPRRERVEDGRAGPGSRPTRALERATDTIAPHFDHRGDRAALAGERRLDDGAAYAQSKLALTMWSRHVADELGANGPVVVAVNPGSLLATKMVKEGFGIAGNDIGIGVDIMTRSILSDEFADAGGRYFDNDARRFADPHPDALDPVGNAAVVAAIDEVIARIGA